jgi:glycerate 2-kinase
LVGGFLALLSKTGKTSVISGMDFVSEFLHLDEHIDQCDIVITGEGSFDHQTLDGKAVAHIVKKCCTHQK